MDRRAFVGLLAAIPAVVLVKKLILPKGVSEEEALRVLGKPDGWFCHGKYPIDTDGPEYDEWLEDYCNKDDMHL